MLAIEIEPVGASSEKQFMTSVDDEVWLDYFKWAKFIVEFAPSLATKLPQIMESCFWQKEVEVLH